MRKIFRLVRAARSIKILNFFLMGFEIFGQVKELVLKILMCIPHVIKLLMIIIMA
jgi:two pore calcium channel protein 1/two pore calcium channel protein 3